MSSEGSRDQNRASLETLIRRLADVARTLKAFDESSAHDPRTAVLPEFATLTPTGSRDTNAVARTVGVIADVYGRHIERLRSYVPTPALADIAQTPSLHRVTVLSCELSRIRPSLLAMEPADATITLSRYAELMGSVVDDNDGVFHGMTASSFLGIFGLDGEEPAEHAHKACWCGLEILAALDQFNAWQKRHGGKPVRCCIGVHTGTVLVGDVPSGASSVVGIVGTPVKVAVALQGLADGGVRPMLISAPAADSLAGELDATVCDDLTVESEGETLSVYAVDAVPPHVDYRTFLDGLFPSEAPLEEEEELDPEE